MNQTAVMTTILTLTSLTSSVFANTKQATIVYGDDDRVETYSSSVRNQNLASSTAGMIESVKLIDLKNAFMLPPTSIKNSMGLCKNERFAEQPSSVICSGFLVGPDLLVTAGHCVTTQARCNEVSFVFDYKINKSTKRADMIVSKKKVFKCKKLIEAKLEKNGFDSKDYALVKLERAVKSKKILKYRSKGMVDSTDSLVVIGHPSGLPQKVAAGASIFENKKELSFFKTNLDTFGGNSGSAVFNNKTGIVEGILVRGAKDYIADSDNKCIRVNGQQEDITGKANLGESVSRITDIPTLKYRSAFFKAAKSGNLESIKTIISNIADVNLLDTELNTSLHMAARENNMAMVKFLIDKGVDPGLRNINGKTAARVGFLNKKVRRVVKAAILAKKKKRKSKL